MSDARYQPLENHGLLSEDRDQDAYRDDPGLNNHAEHERGDRLSRDATPTLKPEGRPGDFLGLALVAGGSAVLVATTWITVLSNTPSELGLFAYHPPLQTLAVALFAFGILTLQPTSQPKTKAAGLIRHQFIILGLAFPCIAVGTSLMVYNKNLHEAPHFTSWHGLFGIISIAWMFIQMFIGAGSVWFGGALFGGGAKAKAVWKYHRLSGYLLFPFFLLIIHLAGAWSTWMLMVTSQVTRIFGYVLAPLAMLVGLWSRARLSKMKFY